MTSHTLTPGPGHQCPTGVPSPGVPGALLPLGNEFHIHSGMASGPLPGGPGEKREPNLMVFAAPGPRSAQTVSSPETLGHQIVEQISEPGWCVLGAGSKSYPKQPRAPWGAHSDAGDLLPHTPGPDSQLVSRKCCLVCSQLPSPGRELGRRSFREAK